MEDNLPKRKSPRLQGFNYSTPRVYFITICTHKRRTILSHIVGAIHESPATQLTKYGNIVEDVIHELPSHYDIQIEKYVIMPNHIHFIVSVLNSEKAEKRQILSFGRRSVIDLLVGFLKMNVSKRMHDLGWQGSIWQRSYHDHIIRDEKDYTNVWNYIELNPAYWEKDRFYEEGTGDS